MDPGSGKSTTIKGIIKMVNMMIRNKTYVLYLGTTGGTASFVIYGASTCHSILKYPINHPFTQLSGPQLQLLQDTLLRIQLISY